jgi:rhodanese-related sulfurtransferase
MNDPRINQIDVRDLHEISRNRAVELIDVRTPEEFRDVRAAGARSVPLDRLDPQQLFSQGERSEDEPIYFICHLGGRSAHACLMSMACGFNNVVNVTGGTDAWIEAGLPVEREG